MVTMQVQVLRDITPALLTRTIKAPDTPTTEHGTLGMSH